MVGTIVDEVDPNRIEMMTHLWRILSDVRGPKDLLVYSRDRDILSVQARETAAFIADPLVRLDLSKTPASDVDLRTPSWPLWDHGGGVFIKALRFV